MAPRTGLKSPARAAKAAAGRAPASARKSVFRSAVPSSGTTSPSRRVDAYIASAAPFAQPILTHIRELVHKAVPDVEEDIKWSMPFFLYRGLMLGNMAGFQQHCSFGLWGKEAAASLRKDGVYDREAMGQLGKLTSVQDLPADRDLIGYLRAAAAEIETGARTQNYSRPKSTAPKPPPEVPPALAAALRKNKAAATHFGAMPPGCQREYCDWISEAKRDDTREKRVATAVDWISAGKRRNWKYESC